MSSLREVAAVAGVSRMTVSNVINGHHNKVSAATIARVRQVIADLEYVPDAQARSLAANRSRMIGMVIHHPDERRDLLENPHDAILLGAVERAATAHGFSLITASSADVVTTASAVGSWRTDGLIVYGSVADENDHVAIGGQAEAISARLAREVTAEKPLPEVFAIGVRALSPQDGPQIPVESIEAAILDRTSGTHRTFRRLADDAMSALLDAAGPAPEPPADPGSAS